jgi:hypothetical protein
MAFSTSAASSEPFLGDLAVELVLGSAAEDEGADDRRGQAPGEGRVALVDAGQVGELLGVLLLGGEAEGLGVGGGLLGVLGVLGGLLAGSHRVVAPGGV